jgi:ankyrin repeat protein
MNNMSSKAIALIAILWCIVGTATAKVDTALCAEFAPPTSSALVLNAIGDGRFALLIECGLKPNEPLPIAGETITPLQLAVGIGRPELVRQVLSAGADPNFRGQEDGLPPLEYALSLRKYAAARALLEMGAKADYRLFGSQTTALTTLVFDEKTPPNTVIAMATELIRRGAELNAIDAKGNTPLHAAVRTRKTEYALALLKKGANACVVNKKGERPEDLVAPEQTSLKVKLTRLCEAPR